MLAQLQEQLLNQLLKRDTAIAAHVLDGLHLDRERRLAIYTDGYRLRLLDALSENYPALHTLLGDTRFRTLGLAYLDAHPSRHFSIRYFGHRLADFVATHTELGEALPVLQEMAAFEWALSEAFDAQDAAVLTVDAMGSIPAPQWPDLRMSLHASVRRLDLEWNVPALWQAVDREQDPLAPQRLDCPIGWLIWRQGEKILFRSLEADEAGAIDNLRNGADFATLCAGLCDRMPAEAAALHAAGFIRRWLSDGLIVRVEVA